MINSLWLLVTLLIFMESVRVYLVFSQDYRTLDNYKKHGLFIFSPALFLFRY